MQPNQNIANQPATGVDNYAGPVVSNASPVANNNVNNSDNDVVFRDKPKKNIGVILGIILLVLIAAGGIGFGVWAMMDGNTQKNALNEQISSLKQQNNELQDKPDANSGNVTNVGGDVGTADYIYVGEWGIKIKIPEDLVSINYIVGFSDLGNSALRVSGMKKPSGSGWALQDFADIRKNVLGSVVRFAKDAEIPKESAPTIVFSNDEYKYAYYHPQAVYSIEESEQDWETASMELIRTMLTTSENYSSI